MSTHLPQLYTPAAAQAAGVPLPAYPDAAHRARSLLERRRRAFGGTLAGMWKKWAESTARYFSRNNYRPLRVALLFLILALFVGVFAVWGNVRAESQTALPPNPDVMAGLEARNIIIVPTATPTATLQPTAEPTATATPDAGSGQAQAISRACLLRIESIGAGEFGGITDTYTLRVGMAQIINTAVQSKCATGDSVAGSLENRWYGNKHGAITAAIIDATNYAMIHPDQFELYNLFGSQVDLHTWYKSSIGDACTVSQTYPIGWANPQVIGLRCLWGK